MVKANNKELLASQILILQLSVLCDHCELGILLQQVGVLPAQSDCQMNRCFLPLGHRLKVMNAFVDIIIYYCYSCCMIMESSLCFYASISLFTSKPSPPAPSQILEKVELVMVK